MKLLPSGQSSSQNKNFGQYYQKSPEKQKLNFPRSALFLIRTRVCLKSFVNDCIWKQLLDSNLI